MTKIKSKYMDWYPVETPQGGDYIICPRCLEWIENDYEKYEKNMSIEKCEKCDLIFNIGCKLSAGGCTSNTFYPVIYIKSTDSSFKIADSSYLKLTKEQQKEYVETCLCIEHNCDRPENYDASYPKNKYPQYYKCGCI